MHRTNQECFSHLNILPFQLVNTESMQTKPGTLSTLTTFKLQPLKTKLTALKQVEQEHKLQLEAAF